MYRDLAWGQHLWQVPAVPNEFVGAALEAEGFFVQVLVRLLADRRHP